jgi:hypothetical protein
MYELFYIKNYPRISVRPWAWAMLNVSVSFRVFFYLRVR